MLFSRNRLGISLVNLVAVLGLTLPVAYAAVADEVAATTANTTAKKLNLKEAVDMATEHSPTLIAAKKLISQRELERKNAFAKFLPSLDLSTTDGISQNAKLPSTIVPVNATAVNPTDPWASSLTLALTDAIYDNGTTLRNYHTAQHNEKLAKLQYEQALDQLSLTVATNYYLYEKADLALTIQREQNGLLRKQLAHMLAEHQQGIKLRIDYWRIKAQSERSDIDLVNAEDALKQADITLKSSLGLEPNEYPSISIVTPIVTAKTTIAGWPVSEVKVEDLRDYQIANLQDRINLQNVDAARRNYLPNIGLNAGVTYGNQNFINSGNSFNNNALVTTSALITLTYNLWDWGQLKQSLRIAELVREQQREVLHQTWINTAAQAKSTFVSLEKLKSVYTISLDLLSLEEQSYREILGQYRDGHSTYLDFITEMSNLLNARLQFYSNYIDSVTAIAKYHFYIGDLNESLRK